MRQQDSGRTREWIEKTAGQTYVTQATVLPGRRRRRVSRGAARPRCARSSRVDWNDLQRLIEGEAIVLFGGRRIYAKLFHAKVDSNGPIRLNVPLMLTAPASGPLRTKRAGNSALAELIQAGDLTRDDEVSVSPVLRAMIDGFKASKAPSIEGRVTAAFEAIKAVAPEPRPDGTHAEPPEGDFRHMLGETSEAGAEAGGTEEGHSGGGDPEIVTAVTKIERLAGVAGGEARRNGLAAVAAGRTAMNAALPITPPPDDGRGAAARDQRTGRKACGMIHDVTADLAPIDRPASRSITRRVLAALDGTPSNAAEIGGRCGLSRVAAARHLASLVKHRGADTADWLWAFHRQQHRNSNSSACTGTGSTAACPRPDPRLPD